MKISNEELEVFRTCRYDKYDIGLVSDQAYMSVVMTNDCNKNCFYCINSHTDKSLYLDIHKAFENIKKCVEKYPIREIVLLGGEPTLHPNLLEFIKMLKTLNLRKIGLTTNGLWLIPLLPGNIIGLANSGIDFINISIDNFSSKKLCEFNDIYLIFKRFNPEIRIRVNTNIYRGNHDNFWDLMDFVESLDKCCDEIRISNLIYKDDFSVNNENSEECYKRILADYEYRNLFDLIEGYYTRKQIPIIYNPDTLGFVEYSAIMRTPIIILNKNIGSKVSEQVCENDIEEKKIHTFKCLVSGDISLSWNTNNIIM